MIENQYSCARELNVKSADEGSQVTSIHLIENTAIKAFLSKHWRFLRFLMTPRIPGLFSTPEYITI